MKLKMEVNTFVMASVKNELGGSTSFREERRARRFLGVTFGVEGVRVVKEVSEASVLSSGVEEREYVPWMTGSVTFLRAIACVRCGKVWERYRRRGIILIGGGLGMGDRRRDYYVVVQLWCLELLQDVVGA